jgi:large subunit ribosomal protein L14e
MAAIEIGRVCIKTRGRDAGSKVVVAGEIKGSLVEIVTPDGKTKKCNIRHLLPLEEKADVEKLVKKVEQHD